jgi:hypothetical protein
MSNRIVALKVTENTLPIITVLNGGVEPDEECLALPTYFIYPLDDADEHCLLVSEKMFFAAYEMTDKTDILYLVTEKH